jgi:hypothetical protein
VRRKLEVRSVDPTSNLQIVISMNGQQPQQQQYQQDPTAFEEIDEPPPEASFAINGIP